MRQVDVRKHILRDTYRDIQSTSDRRKKSQNEREKENEKKNEERNKKTRGQQGRSRGARKDSKAWA